VWEQTVFKWEQWEQLNPARCADFRRSCWAGRWPPPCMRCAHALRQCRCTGLAGGAAGAGVVGVSAARWRGHSAPPLVRLIAQAPLGMGSPGGAGGCRGGGVAAQLTPCRAGHGACWPAARSGGRCHCWPPPRAPPPHGLSAHQVANRSPPGQQQAPPYLPCLVNRCARFCRAKRFSLTTAPRRPGHGLRRSLVWWLRGHRSSSRMRWGMR